MNPIRDRAKLLLNQLSGWSGTVVAVSKYASMAQMEAVYEVGFRHFGENKVLDALLKQQSFNPPDVSWHLIGHLQSNKVNKAVGAFKLIHSVDSLALAQKISSRSIQCALRQPILLQVNIAQETQKTGFSVEALLKDIKTLGTLSGLNLQGLMTIAPHTKDAIQLRRVFQDLQNLKKRCEDHLQVPLPELSMGMSNDFDHAIACGATIIRVGSLIFGIPASTQ